MPLAQPPTSTSSHPRRHFLRHAVATAVLPLLAGSRFGFAYGQDWTPLFDGRSLQGWKESEFPGRGRVAIEAGGILELRKGERMTGITWTGGFPKTSYEIRFDAMRVEGSDFFAGLTFPVADSYCSWIVGGWGGSTVGLSSLDHMDASENETSTERDFDAGRWYSFRLEVRPERIQGWIDGKLVTEADIRGHEVTLRPGDSELSAPLGFAAYKTTARLRRIDYRRL